jgi:hypothetical protein
LAPVETMVRKFATAFLLVVMGLVGYVAWSRLHVPPLVDPDSAAPPKSAGSFPTAPFARASDPSEHVLVTLEGRWYPDSNPDRSDSSFLPCNWFGTYALEAIPSSGLWNLPPETRDAILFDGRGSLYLRGTFYFGPPGLYGAMRWPGKVVLTRLLEVRPQGESDCGRPQSRGSPPRLGCAPGGGDECWGPPISKTRVVTSSSDGILLTESRPECPQEAACAVTSWSPVVEDAREAEAVLEPRLRARLGAFHPELLDELPAAKRHYLGVSFKGHDALLVAGFPADGPFVQTGQWGRPVLMTQLPGDRGLQSKNILFMAWLRKGTRTYHIERLWPEGNALEYASVNALLPVIEHDLLSTALRTVKRKLPRGHRDTCEPPNYSITANTRSQLTTRVLFDCPIFNPDEDTPRQGYCVYASETLSRSGREWRRCGISATTVLVQLR